VLDLGQQRQDAGVAVGGDAESRPCDAHSENDDANFRNVDEFQPGPLRPAPILSTINWRQLRTAEARGKDNIRLQEFAHTEATPPWAIRKTAFMWLDASYKEGNPDLIELNSKPLFDGIRTDPRFGKLMQRVGWRV